VVEDIKEVCDEVKNRMDLFEDWNCIGLVAFYEEAMALILDKKPELLFLDYSIRGGNSFDIIDTINQLENYKPYIIFFTAFQNDQPEIPENAVNKYRINKYLVKPIFEKLTSHLKDYLQEATIWLQKNSESEIWIETIYNEKVKIQVNAVVCISLSANSRNKIVHTKDNKTFEIKASMEDCVAIAKKNQMDYFVANIRECLFNKAYISKICRPFVYLNGDQIKVVVAKSRWNDLDNSN
jgi:response regulator of citrate/malate metabolism